MSDDFVIEKFRKPEQIEPMVRKLQTWKKKIVFTNGCFDIIHPGHVRFLYQAKALGDILIIGMNSDDSVRRIKGNNRPINNEEGRLLVLSALEMTDYIVIFEEDTPYDLIKRIKPDVLVKGGDWHVKDIVGSDIVVDSGGKVYSLPYHKGHSTTEIIDCLSEANK